MSFQKSTGNYFIYLAHTVQRRSTVSAPLTYRYKQNAKWRENVTYSNALSRSSRFSAFMQCENFIPLETNKTTNSRTLALLRYSPALITDIICVLTTTITDTSHTLHKVIQHARSKKARGATLSCHTQHSVVIIIYLKHLNIKINMFC